MILALGACQNGDLLRSARSLAPIPPRTLALMQEKGMSKDSPTLIRSFKKDSELEVWKMTQSGEYALFKTYPICRWSGQLGPKIREGDRQAPEGFYSITPAAMNPNSSLYLSFNMGYPNAYDRAHGRTGAHLMVHGACSSAGCYSMTDEQISEIYAILRESFSGGQKAVQMQALPFRMTPDNLAKHRLDPNIAFWRNLKEGADRFDLAKRELKVGVCSRRYIFDGRVEGAAASFDPSAPCPRLKGDDDLSLMVARKAEQDQQRVADLVSKGTKAIRIVYADGSQHASFRTSSADFGNTESTLRTAEVSRPDALEGAPQEIEIEAAHSKTGDGHKATKGPTSRTGVFEKHARSQPQQPAKADASADEGAAPADVLLFKKILSSWMGAPSSRNKANSPPNP